MKIISRKPATPAAAVATTTGYDYPKPKVTLPPPKSSQATPKPPVKPPVNPPVKVTTKAPEYLPPVDEKPKPTPASKVVSTTKQTPKPTPATTRAPPTPK